MKLLCCLIFSPFLRQLFVLPRETLALHLFNKELRFEKYGVEEEESVYPVGAVQKKPGVFLGWRRASVLKVKDSEWEAWEFYSCLCFEP